MFKRPLYRGACLALAALLGAFAAPALAETKLEKESDKGVYGLGYRMGQNFAQQLEAFELSDAERKLALAGFTDAAGKTAAKTDVEAALQIFQKRINDLAQKELAKQNKENAAFLAKEAKAKGAVKSESGVVFLDLKKGTGKSPKATDKVKVHYKGVLTNGTEFDSSYSRGAPAVFPLGGVISCWTEGIQKMKVGGKARLVCPPELAYGPQGRPGIPPYSILVFEVELLGIE